MAFERKDGHRSGPSTVTGIFPDRTRASKPTQDRRSRGLFRLGAPADRTFVPPNLSSSRNMILVPVRRRCSGSKRCERYPTPIVTYSYLGRHRHMRCARSLPNEALETLRWLAVTMIRGRAPQMATATALRVHKNTVSLWLKWWREGGDAALKPKRRGRTGRKQAQMIEMLKRPEGATQTITDFVVFGIGGATRRAWSRPWLQLALRPGARATPSASSSRRLRRLQRRPRKRPRRRPVDGQAITTAAETTSRQRAADVSSVLVTMWPQSPPSQQIADVLLLAPPELPWANEGRCRHAIRRILILFHRHRWKRADREARRMSPTPGCKLASECPRAGTLLRPAFVDRPLTTARSATGRSSPARG